MTAVVALDELLPVENLGPSLLSSGELARIRPFLPRRIANLLSAQLAVVREELALPLLQTAGAEAALRLFEASLDVVGPVRLCLERALVEARTQSVVLQRELEIAADHLAEPLRLAALAAVGRTHTIMLLHSLRRAGGVGRLWSELSTLCAAAGANDALALEVARPSFRGLSSRARAVDGLLLACTAILEDPTTRNESARPVVRALLERLWHEAADLEREGFLWMLEVSRELLPRTRNAQDLHDRLRGLLGGRHTFRQLAEEWQDAAGPMSNPTHILRYPAFDRIVAMRWEAVPFLLESCQHEDPWFWGPALAQITGEEPDYAPGEQQTTLGVARAWLRLANERGWSVGDGGATREPLFSGSAGHPAPGSGFRCSGHHPRAALVTPEGAPEQRERSATTEHPRGERFPPRQRVTPAA